MKALIKSIPYFGNFSRQLWISYLTWRNDPVRMIERTLGGLSRATVVQVGSNDGKTGDPIHALLRQKEGWNALLIEPVPFLFNKLRANYGAASRFRFENVAITAKAGVSTFFHLQPQAKEQFPDLPIWFDQLGSFNRDHIVRALGRDDVKSHIVGIEIPTVSLSDVLKRNGIQAIDLLHIDTEGYDWVVLQQLDLEVNTPKAILFEHAHLTARDKLAAENFLQARYRLRDLGADYFCSLR